MTNSKDKQSAFLSDNEHVFPMRLQKFLARAGVASRRGSENLMSAGRVTVNGKVVCQLGSKVNPNCDEVALDGVVVHLADGPVTLMLHKPAGVITTMSDPHGRPVVADLVPKETYPGLFPIGRLDADTTGLLLFSTDGELGNGLLHPKHQVTKRYIACVKGRPTENELDRLRQGIVLKDGLTAPADVCLLEGAQVCCAYEALEIPFADKAGYYVVQLTISEGRKHQVKRMLSAIGYPVLALHRDSFGPLELGGLSRGKYRKLSIDEVEALHRAVENSK